MAELDMSAAFANADIADHRAHLRHHHFGRHGMDRPHAQRVLRGDRGDGGRRMAAEHRHRADIGLDSRSPARIGAGDDQDARDHPAHPLKRRWVAAGNFFSAAPTRAGRSSNSPPQFGQRSSSCSAQSAQKVHSNEQMKAPPSSAGKSTPQRSQSGRISSMKLA